MTAMKIDFYGTFVKFDVCSLENNKKKSFFMLLGS